MPKPLASAFLLKAGILFLPTQNPAPSDSEHWPVVAAFNIEAIVGLDGETLRARSEVMGTRSPIKIADEDICARFSLSVDRKLGNSDILDRLVTLETRDDTHSDDYFSAADRLFDDLIKIMTNTSDALMAKRTYVWRKHTDDGANQLRQELSVAKRVCAFTSPGRGIGSLVQALTKVLRKHPDIAYRLDISQQLLESWSLHIGKNHSAILDGVSQIHANASIMRSDISNRISSVARA